MAARPSTCCAVPPLSPQTAEPNSRPKRRLAFPARRVTPRARAGCPFATPRHLPLVRGTEREAQRAADQRSWLRYSDHNSPKAGGRQSCPGFDHGPHRIAGIARPAREVTAAGQSPRPQTIFPTEEGTESYRRLLEVHCCQTSTRDQLSQSVTAIPRAGCHQDCGTCLDTHRCRRRFLPACLPACWPAAADRVRRRAPSVYAPPLPNRRQRSRRAVRAAERGAGGRLRDELMGPRHSGVGHVTFRARQAYLSQACLGRGGGAWGGRNRRATDGAGRRRALVPRFRRGRRWMGGRVAFLSCRVASPSKACSAAVCLVCRRWRGEGRREMDEMRSSSSGDMRLRLMPGAMARSGKSSTRAANRGPRRSTGHPPSLSHLSGSISHQPPRLG